MPIDYDDMMQSGATGLAARYDEKDVMLYALGVGMGRDPLDEKELSFVYENNGLKVVPTFASVINRGEAPPERQRMPQKSSVNFALVVDGERRITFHKPLPAKCEVLSDERMLAILDKGEGKGAVLVQERVTREAGSGDKLFTIVSSIFARGDGGFGGRADGGPQLHEIPARAPDLVKECDTRPDQALRVPSCMGFAPMAPPAGPCFRHWRSISPNAFASSMCVFPSRCFRARRWWWRCGRTAAPFPGAP
jgi:hypothetical protein